MALTGEKVLQEDQLTPVQVLPVLIQPVVRVLIEEDLHTVVLNQHQQEVVHTIVEPAQKAGVVMVVKVNQDVLLMKIIDLLIIIALQVVVILLVIIAHPAVAIVAAEVPVQEEVVLPVVEVHALAVAEDKPDILFIVDNSNSL